MTALSNIVERVERSIFHAIRLELVDKGYLPDVTTFPDTPSGVTAFKTALAAIVGVKGFAVEVFGVGSNQSKGKLAVPRITILEESRLPGALGGDPVPYYEVAGPDTFNPRVLPPQTKDFQYQISLWYNTAEQGRILHGILALALPARGYIKWFDAPNQIERIFVRQSGFSETSYDDEGYREAAYMYMVEDIFDSESATLAPVAKLNEITLEIYPNQDQPEHPNLPIPSPQTRLIID